MDLFTNKKVLPMLFYPGDLFDSKDYLYEIKFDGYRAIVYIDNNSVNIRSRRNNDITYLYPELMSISKCSTKKCILDGELIVMDDKGPNFFKMQKRSLIKDKSKIKQESLNNPVCFVVFDIIYYDNQDLTNLPLYQRKEYLEKYIKENNYLIKSKYVEKEGTKLFKEIKKKKLEGIVAKDKNSIYEIGKRTHSWLKIKVLKEEDFYIIGFKEENKEIKTVVLATKKDNNLILNGEVNLPNKIHRDYIKNLSKNNIIKNSYFNLKNITWLKLKLKGTVRYKEKTKNNSLRHAVFIKFID